MSIFSPEKPKQLNITMANILSAAISGVWPVNWRRLIQEYLEKSIPHIGRKSYFLSPYILHLYHHYGYINEAEEVAQTIVEDKAVYKLGPDVEVTDPERRNSQETLLHLNHPHPLPFRSRGGRPPLNHATMLVPT